MNIIIISLFLFSFHGFLISYEMPSWCMHIFFNIAYDASPRVVFGVEGSFCCFGHRLISAKKPVIKIN